MTEAELEVLIREKLKAYEVKLRERLRTCPQCLKRFFADHGNQYFCNHRCADRSAWVRFYDKRRSMNFPLGLG